MIFGSTISSIGTIAWITKGLAFLASKATAWSKVTNFICSTFIVATTSSCNTSNQRVALQTRRTNTNCRVEVYLALGFAATLSGKARIHTFLRFASFVKRTVFVHLAFI